MKITRTDSVSVSGPYAVPVNKIAFPQISSLNGRMLTGLIFHCNDSVRFGPDGRAVTIGATTLKQGIIYLRCKRGNDIGDFIKIPLSALNVMRMGSSNPASWVRLEIDPVQIDWSNSYIGFPAPFTQPAGSAFLFTLFFQ